MESIRELECKRSGSDVYKGFSDEQDPSGKVKSIGNHNC